MRMSVVLPAPLGPSSPNMPRADVEVDPLERGDRPGIDLHEVSNR